MNRELIIFDKMVFHFLFSNDNEEDLISSSMEFHIDGP